MNIFNSCEGGSQVTNEKKFELSHNINEEKSFESQAKRISEIGKIQKQSEGQSYREQKQSKKLQVPKEGEYIIRCENSQKIIYKGFLFHGMRNGYGIEFDTNQEVIYEGEWKNNRKDGWGKTSGYEGQFRNDTFDGWGKLTKKDLIYEGYFKNNSFYGFGIMIHSDEQLNHLEQLRKQKSLYDLITYSLRNSRQDFFSRYKIKQIYLGDWIKGQMQGFGKLYDMGFEYEGQFAKNNMHGNGVMRKKLQKEYDHKVKKGVFVMGTLKE